MIYHTHTTCKESTTSTEFTHILQKRHKQSSAARSPARPPYAATQQILHKIIYIAKDLTTTNDVATVSNLPPTNNLPPPM